MQASLGWEFLARVILFFLSWSLFAEIDETPFKISLFELCKGENFREITSQILEKSNLPLEMKSCFRRTCRRFFVFTFPSDGLKIKTMISFVDRLGPKPLIVLVRGFSRFDDLPCFGTIGSAVRFAAQSNATIVLSLFRDGVSPGVDEFGGKDVRDVWNLCRFLPFVFDTLNLDIDCERRFMIGLGRGGMEMFLALARFPHLCNFFRSFVSICGILDLNQFVLDNPDWRQKLMNDFRFDGSQKWLDCRNPLLAVSKIRHKNIPILIVQGSEDPFVCLRHGLCMVDTLRVFGFPHVTYWEVAGGNHCLNNRPDCIPQLLEWLGCR